MFYVYKEKRLASLYLTRSYTIHIVLEAGILNIKYYEIT